MLKKQEDRANQIARIVSSLNTDFESDNRAASSLLKGKLLATEFADRLLGDRVYDAAMQAGIDRAFVLQQRAVFELNHPGGLTKAAMEHIDDAIESSDKPSHSLFHTKALVYKALAKEDGTSQAVRDRYLEEALALLKRYGGLKYNYTAGSICEILLLQAKRRLSEIQADAGQKLEDEAALHKLAELERALDESSQRFSGDFFLTSIKADFHTALSNQPKAISLLRRAHEANPANELVALRLARQYVDQGIRDKAVLVLRKASGLNPSSKLLSFELAQALIDCGGSETLPEIGALLRKSFTEGDSHFEAQFWHARHEFLYGERERADRVYQQFERRTHPYLDVARRRAPVRNADGSVKSYEGAVAHIQGDFAFLKVSGLAGNVYLHRVELSDGDWGSLRVGDGMRFKLGFSFRGPAAMSAKLL